MGSDQIRTDDPAVRAALRNMLDVLTAGGGHFHESAWISEQDGSMAIHCPPDSPRTDLLLAVPTELLVPVPDLTWRPWPRFEVADGWQHLTSLQRDALDAMLGVYLATGKAAATEALPEVEVKRHTDLLAAVTSLSGRAAQLERAASVETFLNTRVLGIPASSVVRPDGYEATTSASRISVLMLVADLLNHHNAGAPLRTGPNGLRIPVRQFGGSECYDSYGHRPLLETATHYGFVDRSSTMVAAMPGQVSLVDGTSLQTHAIRPERGRRVPPPRVQRTERGLAVSYLWFDAVTADYEVPLAMAITSHLLGTGRSRTAAELDAAQGLRAILDKTIEGYGRLRDAAATSTSANADMYSQAADVGLGLLAQVRSRGQRATTVA